MDSLIHYGIKCNACGKFPIAGIRYKCIQCNSYNLCEECEIKCGKNHGHSLLQLRNNKQIKMIDNNKHKLKEKNNVEIIYDTNITALLGNDKLESLELTNKNTGSITNLEVSGLFIAIGQIPSNKIFEHIIKMDDNGYILGDDNCHTNIEGIYVAGDTRKKDYRQLTTAVSDGTIAALTAIRELND